MTEDDTEGIKIVALCVSLEVTVTGDTEGSSVGCVESVAHAEEVADAEEVAVAEDEADALAVALAVPLAEPVPVGVREGVEDDKVVWDL